MSQRIVFRADGNKTIGFGHVYRLLALADMLKDHFQCMFAINRPDEIIKGRISGVCGLIELDNDYTYTIPDLIALENQMQFDLSEIVNEKDIVVLDGYHFMQQYQQGLAETGCKQVFIDDLIRDYPSADMIINHAPGINEEDYQTKTKFCLGLGYAMLRNPFFSSFEIKNSSNNIYVSMGGSDIDGYTLMICETLLQVKEIDHIHVLCSVQFTPDQLQKLKMLQQQYNISLHFNLDAHEIVLLMSTCSKAFVASSTVMIEAYSRGLICYTGYTSVNQMHLYKGFVDNGFAKGLGHLKDLSARKIIEVLSDNTVINSLTTPLQSITAHQKNFRELAYGKA